MKFSSDYYSRQSKFLRSNSNLNRLCRDILKWEKSIRWKKTFKDFDYTIMIDNSIEVTPDIFEKIEEIYIEFCKEMKELGSFQGKIKNYNKYKNELEGIISYNDSLNFTINWKHYYDLYRKKCLEITKDERLLANITVLLCYEKYPNKNKKFMWCVAGNGIVKNIKQVDILLPKNDFNGNLDYLGKKYILEKTIKENIID